MHTFIHIFYIHTHTHTHTHTLFTFHLLLRVVSGRHTTCCPVIPSTDYEVWNLVGYNRTLDN